MLRLQGHQGTVHAISFTPDGGTLLSGGADGTVRVWDVAGGRERSCIPAHQGAVLCLALYPKGRVLATGGADCWLKLWDLQTGQKFDARPNQMAPVTGIVWLGERRTVMMACGERSRPERGGELRQYNFDGPAPKHSEWLEPGGYWCLASARSGALIAYGGGSRTVSARAITQQTPKTFKQSTSCLAVALSPDGRIMASAEDRRIKIWDFEAGHERVTLEGHRGLVRALAFSPDGRLLASGGQDRAVRLWHMNAADTSAGPVYEWPIGGIHAVAFSPDGMTAAAAGDQGEILVWDVDA